MNVFCHVVAVKIVCKKRVSMCLPLGNRIPRSYQTSLTKPWFLAGGAAFNSAWWLSRQKLIQKLAPEPSFSMILNNLRIYHDNSWFIHVNWDHYTSIYPIIKYYKCPLYICPIYSNIHVMTGYDHFPIHPRWNFPILSPQGIHLWKFRQLRSSGGADHVCRSRSFRMLPWIFDGWFHGEEIWGEWLPSGTGNDW